MILVLTVSCVFLLDPLGFNSRRIEAAALLPLLLAVVVADMGCMSERCGREEFGAESLVLRAVAATAYDR